MRVLPALDLVHPQPVVARDELDDLGGAHPLILGRQDVLQRLLGQLERQRLRGEGGERDHAIEQTFELTDVRAHLAGDEQGDVVRQIGALDLGLAPQDGHLGLEIGRLDVGDQPPFEAAAQAFLERRDVARRGVRRENDLLLARVERVEGVEELLLGPLLVGQELDVVDQQDVDAPVSLAEVGHPIEAQRADEIVDELLCGQIEDSELRAGALDLTPDGVQQMGLSQADPAVQEERVVALRGRLRHRTAGRVGELIRVADDEGLEDVAWVELRHPGPAGPRRLGFVHREENPARAVRNAGDGAVDLRAVARLQGVQETLAWRLKLNGFSTFRPHAKRLYPCGKLVWTEILAELFLQAFPERFSHYVRTTPGFHRHSTACGNNSWPL